MPILGIKIQILCPHEPHHLKNHIKKSFQKHRAKKPKLSVGLTSPQRCCSSFTPAHTCQPTHSLSSMVGLGDNWQSSCGKPLAIHVCEHSHTLRVGGAQTRWKHFNLFTFLQLATGSERAVHNEPVLCAWVTASCGCLQGCHTGTETTRTA